jgi:integrase/recombinase XerD
MNNLALLGPWVRRFLLEHLVAERNLARNTQRSYRDALILLIPFIAGKLHQSVDRLTVDDVSADLVRLFLADLEQSRKCSIGTRNQRLAAIHALARFVGEHSPEQIGWCAQIRSIPFKKSSKAVISYLDKPQMDALLGAPDRQTAQGRRDHALLVFLYNSGARAQEAAQLLISELDLAGCSVKIRGKECHSYCISFRRRNETTIIHACRQVCDLAFSLADVLLVVRTGFGLDPYTDARGAGRVGPMSEPYPA